MTSGQPRTSTCNAVYSPDDDIAIRFDAESVRLCGQRVEFEGKRCLIEVMPDYYKKRFNPFYKRFNKKRFPRAPVGWLSWYCFFGECDEKKVLKILDFADRKLKKFGFEYVQIENWMRESLKPPIFNFYHDLECDPRKFPHGMRYVADRIRKKGLKAGLWIAPLGTGKEEDFLAHREIFLVDKSGTPPRSWSGKYNLDPTHPGAKRQIRSVLRTVTRDWGYEYLKIDGLECGGDPVNDYYMDTLYERKDIRRLFHSKEKDPLRNVALLIRKAIGRKTFFTVCGGKTKKNGKFVGVGDAARIGGDIFWEGEDPAWGAVVNTARVTLRAYHVHNVFWYNDPDVLSIRKSLNTRQAHVLCTIVGLTGQSLFAGDILYELPEERVKMLQRLMPVCDTYPAHLARNESLQPVWNLMIRRSFEQWNVVALFNWSEKRAHNLKVTAAELGLDPDKTYLMYDFWSDAFLGVMRGTKTVKLEKQSCRVVAIREKTGRPQILSIDRHITQGGVCIKEVTWDRKKLSLSAVMDLPRGERFSATLYVPGDFVLRSAGGTAKPGRRVKNIVKLRVGNGRWECRFGMKKETGS